MLNADQTAIQCEMASGRTLTIKGVKKVTRVVQRQAATMHSFTLQVCLSVITDVTVEIFNIFLNIFIFFNRLQTIHLKLFIYKIFHHA